MPTPAKTSENMTKHTTKAEQEVRLAAEESVNPDRGEVVLKKPTWLKGKGSKYWDSILERMESTAILDDLDSEMLAVYCSQLHEREKLLKMLSAARKPKDGGDPKQDDILAISKRIDALDRSLLSYAEKLGCTPSGRVRLAQKRAAAAAEIEPNGDLFGD